MAILSHTTTLANFGPNVLQDVYLEKTFVPELRKNLVAHPLGQNSTLPSGTGKDIRWQFFSTPASADVTGLLGTEGTDPVNSTDFTTTPIAGQLLEYGSYTPVTRFLLDTALSGTQEKIVSLLAYQASLTIDTLVLKELDTTSNTQVAVTAADAEDLRLSVANLVASNVLPHPSTPGFFCAIFSAEAAYDMMGEATPKWSDVKREEFEGSLIKPFQGTPVTAALYGAIVKISTNVQAPGAVDQNFVLGADSFGVASLDTNAMSPQVVITRPQDNTSAPVRNNGTMGWWLLYDTELFDSARVVNLTSPVT